MIHCEAEKEEMTMEAVKQRSKTYDLVYISILVVLITVCSWISIPLTVPVTLQTFGVFTAVGLSGRKTGDTGCTGIYSDGSYRDPCIFRIYRRDRHSGRNYRRIYRRLSLSSALIMWGMEKLFWEKYPGADRFHGPGTACLLCCRNSLVYGQCMQLPQAQWGSLLCWDGVYFLLLFRILLKLFWL